jgi:ribA/ribD-fused uncharacterized protein
MDIVTRNGFILFWGGWPSNWEPSVFLLNGQQYNCVEQWMMAEKARTFGDEEVRAKILASPYPRAQKEFGRKVRNYDDAKWAETRYPIVLAGTMEKYRQNPKLREFLLATADTDIFVEASPHDKIWGIGLSLADPRAWNKATWLGQNLLGQAITEARTELRKGA